uniref:Rab11-FIP3/4 domain-containing protein n=2 Tax=Onchocerca TaxID=6281 RepID=A0A8R1XT68_ONCVO
MRLNNNSSSASVASRLYTNGTRGSQRGSFSSEPELMSFSDTETSIHELNEICSQVSSLSKKVNDLEQERMSSGEEKARLRADNAILIERVHILEEQLQAAEQSWREKLSEEKSRNRDIISRMEREKQLEIESAALKYQVLEKDCVGMRKEKDKMCNDMLHLQLSLENVKDQLIEANAMCETLEEARIKIERDFKRYREEAQHDIDSSSELVEELSRQTDELRRQKNETLPRASVTEQIISLENEVNRYRKENKELKRQNEDLQAQLIHDSIEAGQNLLKNFGGDPKPSLAEELSGKDSTELMNALKEQEICNQKLRNYINGILMREQCTSQSSNDAIFSSQQCTKLPNHESSLSSSRFASKENFTTKLYNYWSADWKIFRFTSPQS